MTLEVTHFTDPGCPYAFSAEPALQRLRWLYGGALSWTTVMVGLADDPAQLAAKGLTPEIIAESHAQLAREHGMPIDATPHRLVATMPACRAVVAAGLRAPSRRDALLRRLRVLNMGGRLLDEPETIDQAAREAGLDPAELTRWCGEPEVETKLQADMLAARSPAPSALALDHKLAPADYGPAGRRYTCPSYEFGTGEDRVAVPGFQPLAAYEVAISHLAPELPRAADPDDPIEVLAWAAEPLATAEVVAVCNTDPTEVRTRLAQQAEFNAVGTDGYWSQC